MRVIIPCPRPHCILTSPSLQDNHQIFASGSDDCTAIVWDQRSKKQLQSLYHDYQVHNGLPPHPPIACHCPFPCPFVHPLVWVSLFMIFDSPRPFFTVQLTVPLL